MQKTMNVKNKFIKESMIKYLFGIVVIVSVNRIKRVVLVNIYTMKIVNAEKE